MTSVEEAGAQTGRFAVILGATSLIGPYLARRLAEDGFRGWCVSRDPARNRFVAPPGFAWKTVLEEKHLDVPASAVLFSLVPMSALPAVAGRIGGGDRLIALSTSSVYFKSTSSDPEERLMVQGLSRAETDTRSICERRGIAWTIFRPTLIYDMVRDRNVSTIAAIVRRYGMFPVVWPGSGLRQPIHAADVAQAMSAAAGLSAARGAVFDLPGGETLTYREMVRRIFEASGRRPILLYLPPGLARLAFRIWRRVTRARYSVASLERMNLDLTVDPAPVTEALGVTCRPFRPVLPEPPDAHRLSRASGK